MDALWNRTCNWIQLPSYKVIIIMAFPNWVRTDSRFGRTLWIDQKNLPRMWRRRVWTFPSVTRDGSHRSETQLRAPWKSSVQYCCDVRGLSEGPLIRPLMSRKVPASRIALYSHTGLGHTFFLNYDTFVMYSVFCIWSLISA